MRDVKKGRRETLILAEILTQQAATVLIVVAMVADIFPVGTIGRVVMVVAVLVMDGEMVQVGSFKLAAALGADPAMNTQGL